MARQDNIHHDREAQAFTLAASGDKAILQYRLSRNPGPDGKSGSVDFTHTYVPPQLRGQGLAESLVRHGLAWAKQENYDIHASCWYVAKFLR